MLKKSNVKTMVPTEPKLLGNIIKDVTSGKLPMPALAPIAPVAAPAPVTRMSEKALKEWLDSINQGLRNVGRLAMTDSEIKGFCTELFARKFTLDHADQAEHYLLFGKRTNFTEKKVISEMFYPTAADMQQFKVEFIPIALADAKLREAVRQEKIIQKEMEANHERDKRTLRDEIAWLRTPGRVSVENSPESIELLKNLSKDLENKAQEKKFEKKVKSMEIDIKSLNKQRVIMMLRLHELGESVEFTNADLALLQSMDLIEINELEQEIS